MDAGTLRGELNVESNCICARTVAVRKRKKKPVAAASLFSLCKQKVVTMITYIPPLVPAEWNVSVQTSSKKKKKKKKEKESEVK